MPDASTCDPAAWVRRVVVALSAVLLVACGGGGGGGGVESARTCDVGARKAWLRDYMDDWYFWYRISPRPNPEPFETVDAFFDALLYGGADPSFPRDRWSGFQSTESFNRFFGDGQALGYGLSVNGLEAVEVPGTPLYVRYVEPLSDAARQGVRRGDEVRSIDGVPAADLIRQVADNRFTVLSPTAAGTTATLVLRSGGVDRSVVVRADVFALTPVAGSAVYTSQGGRRIGYLAVKDMISQAERGLDAAFQGFRQQGVQDLVLDLRYNPGGSLGTAAAIARHLLGGGRALVVLVDRHTASAAEWLAAALRERGGDRVTLVGERTFGKGRAQWFGCSPDELTVLAPAQALRTVGGARIDDRGVMPDRRTTADDAPWCAHADRAGAHA